MELSLISVLAIFVLFAFSGGAYFLARRTGIPHTVLLVALGVVLVPLSHLGALNFLKDFSLTPELLFYIFLPTLIFESAYNINLRRLTLDAVPVALLSIVSLLISALTIAAGMYYLLPLIGFPIPFSVAFIFGSLISATDPVAVLALFKEYGAPRRLSLLFEGESLFNDGTGLALFLVAIEFALRGGFSTLTLLEGILSFSIMIVGGALFGIIVGGIFAKFIGYARSSESVAITLTLVLAHVTFLLSEYISSHLHIGGMSIHLSSIIATTMAAMVMGNYGRAKLPHGAEEFVEKFWGQVAFLANSIIFILIGMLAISLPLKSPELFVPIALVVVLVASARALSIYPVVALWNNISDAARHIPSSWQHLLAWGSLRGALAVTMALLIPGDLVVEGWAYELTVQEMLLAFTTGCIFVTLFIKATTIGALMKYFGVNTLGSLETAEYDEGRLLVYGRVLERLARFAEKQYISSETYVALKSHYERRFAESREECSRISNDPALARSALRIWMLGVEKKALQNLYTYGEISEHVYKRILAKLAVRTEQAEAGVTDFTIHIGRPSDAFESLAQLARRILKPRTPAHAHEDEYMYYRALSVLSQKAQKELARIKTSQSHGLFAPGYIQEALDAYTSFRTHALEITQKLAHEHPETIAPLAEHLARCGVLKVEENTLEQLIEREMITPKVHAALTEELEHDRELLEARA